MPAPSSEPLRKTPHSGMLAQIYREILADDSLLPSLPDIALRVREAVADPRHDIDMIAKIVQTDPSASAYLVRIANSPLYRTRVPIQDVKAAIRRFGTPATRTMVVSHTLGSMFDAGSPMLYCLMRDSWRRSAQLGAISAVLASRCGFDPDRAMLAGLLQEIGALPLLAQLGRRTERLVEPQRVEATLAEFTPKIGVMLLRHWNFGAELISVVRSRHEWLRDAAPDADLADLVLVARFHALQAQGSDGLPTMESIPAFAKLAQRFPSAADSCALVAEAQAEIAEVLEIIGA